MGMTASMLPVGTDKRPSRFPLAWPAILLSLAFAFAPSSGSAAEADTREPEPQWLPPLAESISPDCPRAKGTREARSVVVVLPTGHRLFLSGLATNKDGGCSQTQALVGADAKSPLRIDLQSVEIPLEELRADSSSNDRIRAFAVIDSTPSGDALLLERRGTDWPKDLTYRDVQVASLDLAHPEKVEWLDVWDLMHWGDCNATVETQGYDAQKRPVVLVRPSVWSSHPKPSCVDRPELWAIDLPASKATRLPNDARVTRSAHTAGNPWTSCKRDPDLTGPCFKVHGRLSVWNGAPALRISKIGTKRILGVTTETVPDNVTIDFDKDVYGDFEVCPFSNDKPGAMRMVCIESASNLIVKTNVQ